ncbi:MAG: DUF1302 family protein [Fidelibacterota bacterium]
MKKRFGILILIQLSVAAGQVSIGGYVKGFAYVNPYSGEYSRLGTRFQTRFSGDNGRTGFLATINMETDQVRNQSDSQPGNELALTPVELYVDFHFDQSDFRLGRQFIFWGSADWVNPTDVINPWDFLNLSSEIEDYRIPVFAGSWTYYWNQFTLQSVLVPGFSPTKVPLPDYTEVTLPPSDWNHPQGGFRMQSYVGATDVSLAYFSGFNQLPTLIFEAMNFSVSPPLPMFTGHYSRQQMIGGDFSRTWEQWGFKGEAAYIRTPDVEGTDVFEANPYFESVIGFDYIFSESLNLNGQYVNKTYTNYSKAEEEQRILDQGYASYLEAPEKTTHSVTGRISWNPIPYVNGQIITVYNFLDGDSFVLAFASWEPRDAVSITLGSVLFSGPASSEYGRLDSEDLIFLEIKQSF